MSTHKPNPPAVPSSKTFLKSGDTKTQLAKDVKLADLTSTTHVRKQKP